MTTSRDFITIIRNDRGIPEILASRGSALSVQMLLTEAQKTIITQLAIEATKLENITKKGDVHDRAIEEPQNVGSDNSSNHSDPE